MGSAWICRRYVTRNKTVLQTMRTRTLSTVEALISVHRESSSVGHMGTVSIRTSSVMGRKIAKREKMRTPMGSVLGRFPFPRKEVVGLFIKQR
jgi:hypothetical protein